MIKIPVLEANPHVSYLRESCVIRGPRPCHQRDIFHHFDDSDPQAGIPEFLEPMADALPALSSHIEVVEDEQMSFLMTLEKGH